MAGRNEYFRASHGWRGKCLTSGVRVVRPDYFDREIRYILSHNAPERGILLNESLLIIIHISFNTLIATAIRDFLCSVFSLHKRNL